MELKIIEAGVLRVAYRAYGPEGGWPCVMGHGFPYDVESYSESAEILAGEGARVIVPYLRGYGPTRFLSGATPRSGEQAALGADMRALMDALGFERAVLGGYDWVERGQSDTAQALGRQHRGRKVRHGHGSAFGGFGRGFPTGPD